MMRLETVFKVTTPDPIDFGEGRIVKVWIIILLDNRVTTYTRTVYSFLDLSNDFGGFSALVFIVCASMMSYYSEHLFILKAI